jgi:CRISPR-associated helicase Cas3/CRISPR-associated endonuclease Cas3-HD
MIEMELLAKSNPEITLREHIEDCLCIQKQLRFLFPNISANSQDEFWDLLYISMVCHDLGKAHKDFQNILKKKTGRWSQRHELFSLPFIWGLPLSDEQKNKISFSVAGHHKDFNKLFEKVRTTYREQSEENVGSDQTGNLDYFDIIKIEGKKSFLDEFEKIDKNKIFKIQDFYLSQISLMNLMPIQNSVSLIDVYELINEYKNQNYSINSNDDYLNLLFLVGATKQCDHLASAGIKNLNYLEEADFDYLNKISALHFHQSKCSKTVGNVILNAPTGSGKTEASFLWLKNQINHFGQGRVFYILPFTASINAMYERLKKEMPAESSKIGMIHGKLEEYIENKFSVEMEDESENFEENEEKRKQIIEDFKTMITPVKIVTPFQLLKYLFGVKGFEKGLFELAGSYLIFDEIHAYDPVVFAQIIVLLRLATQKLNAKVLIMTATLPTFMKNIIENAIGPYSFIQAENSLYDSFERHRIKLLEGRLGCNLEIIQKHLDGGEKVLVVCNTVAESQRVYDNLSAGNKVLLHGSFNSKDRFDHETKLKMDFVNLLVGTQAIEVSLDIDYDVIFTESAPFDALIQRFGRVNRKKEKGVCDCFVFQERNEKDSFIYAEEEINRTLEILEKIESSGGIVKEKELQSMMDFVYPNWNEKDKKEFSDIVKYLEYFVYNELSPCHNSENEDKYYEQFKGVQVLPISLKKTYSDFLDKNQFVKAESLLVQISEPRFIGMIKNGEIERDWFAYESKKNGKIKDKSVYVIKRKYDCELGLLINEEDTNKSFEFY